MRVLFIGNSHTYFNDMPRTFADLWQNAFGEKADVTVLAYSYRSLKWHSDEYFTVRYNLLYGDYDACVIQQCAHPFPGYEATRDGVQTILRLCRTAKVTPYLMIPWCEQRFPENQEKIITALTQLAEDEKLSVVPVAQVWQEFQCRMPAVSLYWNDGEHASVVGDYLIAVTTCMAISGRTDIALSDTARDFTQGKTIDFDKPSVCEDTDVIPCRLEQSIVDAVSKSAKAVFSPLSS